MVAVEPILLSTSSPILLVQYLGSGLRDPLAGTAAEFAFTRRARKALEHRLSGCGSRLSVTSVEHWRLSYSAPLKTTCKLPGDGLTPG